MDREYPITGGNETVTDDSESRPANRPQNSNEESEDSDPELRTDGGHTIASNTPARGPTEPIEPDGVHVPGGPAIGRASIDGSTSIIQESGAPQEESRVVGNHEGADWVVLQPFQELCGRLKEIQRTDQDLIFILSSGAIRFPSDTEEARICLSELEGREGSQVRILRTPDSIKPLFVTLD